MKLGVERWIGIVAGTAAGLALLWYLYAPPMYRPGPEPEPEPVATQAPAAEEPPAVAPAAPPAAPPVAAAAEKPAPPPAKAPEPELAASDGMLREALAGIFGADPVEAFLIRERIVQNIVATVDSLDRDPIPVRFRAVAPVPELPVVASEGDAMWLDPANDARYTVHMHALAAADSGALAALYTRYHPLFQRAYEEMGYPGASFDARVLQVIDHLLAAPEPEGPIELVRPKVLYRFADPELEALSSGHKLMIRLGPANAATVKDWLRELRAQLAAPRAGRDR
jgi:hypothetical protein